MGGKTRKKTKKMKMKCHANNQARVRMDNNTSRASKRNNKKKMRRQSRPRVRRNSSQNRALLRRICRNLEINTKIFQFRKFKLQLGRRRSLATVKKRNAWNYIATALGLIKPAMAAIVLVAIILPIMMNSVIMLFWRLWKETNKDSSLRSRVINILRVATARNRGV